MTELGALGPPPRRVHPDAMFSPHSITARVLLNPFMLLGGPRAVLLQIAHPLVAAGVADHSNFQESPFDRLLRTISAVGTVGFADPATAQLALSALAATHASVRGRSPEGRPYSAGDPRLAAWVHATLIDTALVVERHWLGELSGSDRAAFYVETLALARAFGARVEPAAPGGGGSAGGGSAGSGSAGSETDGGGLPGDLASFESWMEARVNGLTVSDQARSLAPEVLRPPLAKSLGWLGRPAERVSWPTMAAITAELLPPRLCLAYGLSCPQPMRPALAAGRCLTRSLAPLGRLGAPRPDRATRLAAVLTGQRV